MTMTREQLVESRAEAIEATAIERHLSRLAAIEKLEARLTKLKAAAPATIAELEKISEAKIV